MKSTDRLYAPNHICHDCKHAMKYHTIYGCNLTHCICKVSNMTFTMLINGIAYRQNNFFNRKS